MAKVKIYGSQRSRAARVTWCAKEISLDFEQIEMTEEQRKNPDFLAINPNGKVPALVDGDVKMFESLAINLYLAKKYGKNGFYPAGDVGDAKVLQWTMWAGTEVEPFLMPSLMVALGYSQNVEGAKVEAERAKSTLKVLDAVLAKSPYILGKDFTIADLQVASVVGAAEWGKVDLSGTPHVVEWMKRCTSRPARN